MDPVRTSPATVLRGTYIEIPQVPETHAVPQLTVEVAGEARVWMKVLYGLRGSDLDIPIPKDR